MNLLYFLIEGLYVRIPYSNGAFFWSLLLSPSNFVVAVISSDCAFTTARGFDRKSEGFLLVDFAFAFLVFVRFVLVIPACLYAQRKAF